MNYILSQIEKLFDVMTKVQGMQELSLYIFLSQQQELIRILSAMKPSKG